VRRLAAEARNEVEGLDEPPVFDDGVDAKGVVMFFFFFASVFHFFATKLTFSPQLSFFRQTPFSFLRQHLGTWPTSTALWDRKKKQSIQANKLTRSSLRIWVLIIPVRYWRQEIFHDIVQVSHTFFDLTCFHPGQCYEV
jgi:hypothetical protein